MHERPLQNVFRRDRIEVRFDDLSATRVILKDLTAVQCGADFEIVLEDIFQRSRFLRVCQATKKHKNYISRIPESVGALLWLMSFCSFLWLTSQRLRV